MTDPRFYRSLGPVEARELARRAGCEIAGDGGLQIATLAPPESAGPSDLTFVWEQKRIADVETNRPAACIAPPDFCNRLAGICKVVLTHESPRMALASVASQLFAPIEPDNAGETGSGGAIDPSATIASGAHVGAGAKIGPRSVIGPNAVIGPGVVIGADCRIGAGCHVGFAVIGDRTEIGVNSVIGAAGFGIVLGATPHSIPHLGVVRIGSDVRIGALCTVDRAMFDETVLEDHVKIDSHCHIAHNCRIGRGAIIAAFGGISGSVTVGEGAILAGRVGLADHVNIGAGAILGANAGVLADIPAGERWIGSPARPHRQFMREMVTLARLARGKTRGDGGGDS